MKKLILVFVLLVFGCANNPQRQDTSYFGSFVTPFELINFFEENPCEGINLNRDRLNCGSCGNVCNIDDSDRCESGTCLCGLNPACGPGQDCRNGQCITSDPNGKICEFDDECGAGFACIEAHCSFIECAPGS